MKKAFVMALFAIGIMGKSEVHANTYEYLVADTLSSEAFSKQLDAVSIEIKKAEVEVKNAKKTAYIQQLTLPEMCRGNIFKKSWHILICFCMTSKL